MTGPPFHIHDRGYKSIFSFKKLFSQLIEGYVDTSFSSNLDLNNSIKENKNFILKEFDEIYSDILYTVPLLDSNNDKVLYLYILTEHQSGNNHTMPFRLLNYNLEILRDYFKNTKKKIRERKDFLLPPVFNILLYTSNGSWNVPLNFFEKVDGGDIVKEYIPNLRYHLIDLSKISNDVIREKNNTLSSVFLFENIKRSKNKAELLSEVMTILDKEEDEEISITINKWILIHLQTEEEKKTHAINNIDIDKLNRMEGRKMIESLRDQFIAEGEAIGKAEGEAIGKAQGEAIGKAQGEARIAKNMLKANEPIEKICLYTGLPKEKVLKLKESDN